MTLIELFEITVGGFDKLNHRGTAPTTEQERGTLE
jgi:hypothetical protein